MPGAVMWLVFAAAAGVGVLTARGVWRSTRARRLRRLRRHLRATASVKVTTYTPVGLSDGAAVCRGQVSRWLGADGVELGCTPAGDDIIYLYPADVDGLRDLKLTAPADDGDGTVRLVAGYDNGSTVELLGASA